MMRREAELVRRRVGLSGGDVLSVGCGWHPGRHLFPAPAFRLVAVDADPDRVAGVAASGAADEALVGYAGRLDLPAASFDVVLYRLVLHHLAFQGPLQPCFAEAARLVRPGGALVAIEPGSWHPVGFGLTLANRAGAATALHGTPDDIPLSPVDWPPKRAPPAYSPSCTRSPTPGGGCRRECNSPCSRSTGSAPGPEPRFLVTP